MRFIIWYDKATFSIPGGSICTPDIYTWLHVTGSHISRDMRPGGRISLEIFGRGDPSNVGAYIATTPVINPSTALNNVDVGRKTRFMLNLHSYNYTPLECIHDSYGCSGDNSRLLSTRCSLAHQYFSTRYHIICRLQIHFNYKGFTNIIIHETLISYLKILALWA